MEAASTDGAHTDGAHTDGAHTDGASTDPVGTGAADGTPTPAEPSAGAMRYAGQVTAVGRLVPEFAEQRILVFFGSNAPAELHDFAVLHNPTVVAGGLRPGDEIVIDDTVLPVLAVGDVAEQNLINLGHLNVKANGQTQAPLPGDVCVDLGPLPLPRPGSRFRIQAATGG